MQFFTKTFLFLCLFTTLSFAQKKPAYGIASYYSDKFNGKRTANGEHYNKCELTAAHPSLPFNTRIKVTCMDTKKSVVVRINDRGPRGTGRALDMSRAAAEKIGLVRKGKAKVKIEVLNKKQWKA